MDRSTASKVLIWVGAVVAICGVFFGFMPAPYEDCGSAWIQRCHPAIYAGSLSASLVLVVFGLLTVIVGVVISIRKPG